MKPLLAHVYEPHRVTFPCFVQPKLNGVRALYQNGCFQSRDGLPFPSGLLDHLAKPLRELFDPRVILDGELYVHGWSLPKILGAITPIRQEPTEDTLKVEYHVFDVVDFGKSFADRHHNNGNILQLIDYHPQIKLVEGIPVRDEEWANEYYSRFVSRGYEGMMYRLGDCPYTVPKAIRVTPFGQLVGVGHELFSKSKFLSDKDNRCWHLLKRKDWQDDEFDFVSIRSTVGEKGEAGFIMTVKSPPGAAKPTFDLGAGLTDHEIEIYLQNPPVNQKVKAKYLCLSPYGIPLNATILAVL